MSRLSPVVSYWGPPVLYAALIFWLSSLSTVPSAPRHVDKVFHFFEYSLLAKLFWRAFGGTFLRLKKMKRALLVFCITVPYAASDEIHQMFVKGRTASLYDWIADVAGILGMLTLMVIKVKWKDGSLKYDPI